MNCVILGPTDKSKITRYAHIDDIDKYISEAAIFFAECFDEVLIVPDEGLPFRVAMEYKKRNTKGIITGYLPDKTSSGKDISNFSAQCDRTLGIGGGWHNLNTELTRKSEVVFILGFSAGVFIELCSIKYNQKYLNLDTKIYIDKRCISGKIVGEVAEDINNLSYFNDFNEAKKYVRQETGN